MSRARIPSHLRRDVERHVADAWCGPPIDCGHRSVREPVDGCWLRLSVDSGHAVIACHAPRAAGAGMALALTDRVAALFRGHGFGPLRFGSPSVELDGRDPAGFRAVVTVPIRHTDDASPSWRGRR